MVAPYSSNTGKVRARRCAVQALYQWDLSGQAADSIVAEFIAERELVRADLEYFSTLVTEVCGHADELRAEIEPVLDRSWSRLGPVERCILLLGGYELKFCPHIPWRVVINEAIELEKLFGADEAHRYINGVLDRLARRMRATEAAH